MLRRYRPTRLAIATLCGLFFPFGLGAILLAVDHGSTRNRAEWTMIAIVSFAVPVLSALRREIIVTDNEVIVSEVLRRRVIARSEIQLVRASVNGVQFLNERGALLCRTSGTLWSRAQLKDLCLLLSVTLERTSRRG